MTEQTPLATARAAGQRLLAQPQIFPDCFGRRDDRDFAFDLRANNIGSLTAGRIRDDLARRIGDEYQIFYESFPRTPAGNHIRVEYDPRRR